MAEVKIVLNHAGMRQLLKSKGVQAALDDSAKTVLARAKGHAPVRTGAYLDSLKLWHVQHPSRVVSRVGSDVDYALVVEAAYGVLSRSLG